jgi:transposase-like protein
VQNVRAGFLYLNRHARIVAGLNVFGTADSVDHRAVKRIIRPMLGFKSFRCARVILGGLEIMHMICKGQMRSDDVGTLSAAQQFYSLAA